MATKTIADIDVTNKAVLMRMDFNVPLKNGEITNDMRIVMGLPSIKKVLQSGGKLVLMSHLGRPKGEVKKEFSLAPVTKHLGKLLGRDVQLGPDCVVGPKVEEIVAGMKAGDVLLLENVRFDLRETSKDETEMQTLGDEFAKLGDVYVNDAFGTCHRKQASMYGAPKAIQRKGGPAVCGYLVEKEIKYLHQSVAEPKRPFVAILGGAKVSDKIKLIGALLDKVDKIIIGGAMAYTLLKSQGVAVGRSLVEEDQLDAMKKLLAKAGDKIALPCDHICTDDFANGVPVEIDSPNIPENLMGMDIGAKSIEEFDAIVAKAGTIVWNGPMGVFENPNYATGTRSVAEAVAKATDNGAVSVIGGGDSVTAVQNMNLADRMTHVSTGGGASLTYLEGKPMPAIEVLDQK